MPSNIKSGLKHEKKIDHSSKDFLLYDIKISNGVDDITLYFKDLLKQSYETYSNLNMNINDLDNRLANIDYILKFQDFLENYLEKNKLKEEDINKVGYKGGTIYLYFNGKETPEKLAFSDFQKELVFGEGVDLESLEFKAKAIRLAMDTIFHDNNSWYDELDLTDKFDTETLVKLIKKGELKALDGKTIDQMRGIMRQYNGKNLHQLRDELSIIDSKFVTYYDIIGDTKKSVDILDKQINHYAGIGDEYERGARLFGLKSEDVDKVTSSIVSRKTVPELIDYIRVTNNTIADNWKISDFAKNTNIGVIQSLAMKTFEKMKTENSSNREFINLIQVITGKKITDSNGKIKESNVDIKADFGQTKIAREILIYLFYNRGIVEHIGKKHKLILNDKAFGKETSVKKLVDEAMKGFEALGNDKNEVIKNMGLEKILEKKDTSELSFDEMLLLGGVCRIGKDLKKNINSLKGKSPDEIISFIQEKNRESMEEAFEELNSSFEKNFGATFWDFNWDGVDAKELGLEGDFAEIFNLFWDINGTGWFDVKDDSWIKHMSNRKSLVVIATGIITAVVVLSPAVLAAGGASLLIAGAKIGLTTTVAYQVLSDQGYDTNAEAAVGITVQSAIDITSSMFFTWFSGAVIPKTWGKFVSNNMQNKLPDSLKNTAIKDLEEAGKSYTKGISKSATKLQRSANEITDEAPKRTTFGRWRQITQAGRKELQDTAKELGDLSKSFSSLSPEAQRYIIKYMSLNGKVGTGIDFFVGLGDGFGSSIAYMITKMMLINPAFAENHFNPDAGETMDNVAELRAQHEKEARSNTQLQAAYNNLSENDKLAVNSFNDQYYSTIGYIFNRK
ncbi:hypothetical protein D8B46_08685 [Candidatus Gracilibacteria bacterium]|nr:MAG: hypothetical protein D8B46_08685 [Candidatus Gracilibacteria bacterium]